MVNLLDTQLLRFISKNRVTTALVVLLAGNIYQYVQRDGMIEKDNEEKRQLNQKLQDQNAQTIEYERVRSEKLEFLLSNLAKSQPDAKVH